MSSSNPSEALQAALQAIEEQYEAAKAFVDKMREDQSQISKLENSAAYWQGKEHYTTVSCGPHGIVVFHHHTDWHAVSEYNHCQSGIQRAQNDMKARADELKAKFGPIFAQINATLESLMACVQQIIASGGSSDFIASDLAAINHLISQLFDAMKKEIKAVLFEQQMQGKNGAKLTTSELAQLAQGGMQASLSALSIVNDMWKQIDTLINDYQTAENNAKVDKARFNFWEANFTRDSETIGKDEAIIDNAEMMEGVLENALTALSPVIASLQPEFTSLINTIERIVKEIKKLLSDTHMDPKAKQKEVLGLVMYLLTFFQLIKQEVENNKAAQNKDMTQGAIQASKNNVDDVVAQEKIKAEMEKNAKVMKITMIITEVVLGAVLMATSGGVGGALMAGLIAAFETTQTAGVFDATGALGDAMGSKIGAEVLVGVTEAALTVGASLAANKLAAAAFKTAVKEAVDTSMKKASVLIEQAAAKAAALAGKAGDEVAVAAASDMITQIVEKAALRAAQSTVEVFVKQPFGVIVEYIAKGTFKKEVQLAIEKAAQQGIEESIESAGTIAKLAARGVTSSAKIVDDVAIRAGDSTAASVTKQPLEKVAVSSNMGWTKGSVAAMVIFGLMSNNVLVDGMKKVHLDDGSDVLDEIFEIIQMLMAMIAFMAGSGAMAGISLDQMASKLPRAVNLLSTIPTTAQATGSAALAGTYDQESKAITALTKNEGMADLLHSFLEQLQKDATLDRDAMVKEQTAESSTTSQMAGHLHDGELAEINVMISAIG